MTASVCNTSMLIFSGTKNLAHLKKRINTKTPKLLTANKIPTIKKHFLLSDIIDFPLTSSGFVALCVCVGFVQLQRVADVQCVPALCPLGLLRGVPVSVSGGGMPL